MKFKENKTNKEYEYLGYIIMYFIFTTILYLILTFLNKIPETWNYLHVMAITIIIILISRLIKYIIK